MKKKTCRKSDLIENGYDTASTIFACILKFRSARDHQTIGRLYMCLKWFVVLYCYMPLSMDVNSIKINLYLVLISN